MRWALLMAVTLVAASGCSRIRWAYPWLDWVLEDRAERYLELDEEQEEQLERAIERYLAWHRESMLPRYSATLRRIATRARSGPIDAAAATAVVTGMRGLWDETFAAMAQPTAQVLCGQNAAQIDSFEQRLAERQAELAASDEEQRDERRAERADDFVEQIEELVGPLRAEQERALRARMAELGGDRAAWLHERQRRNRVLLAKLRASAPEADVAAFVRAWWTGNVRSPDPTYARYAEQFSQTIDLAFGELLVSLHADQRQTLAETFEGYAADFEFLAPSARSVRH